MKLKEIYFQYNVPPNLQQHMLRVGGICKIILDQISNSNLIERDVVIAALLHDCGNIIKFDFEKYPDVGDIHHGSDYWINVQAEFKRKYGTNEHHGTIEILREIGLGANIISIVDNADWPKLLEENSLTDANLLIYADMRVGPSSILGLDERLNELIERDQAKGRPVELYTNVKEVALQLEAKISKLADLGRITSESVNNMFADLLEFEII